MHDAPSRVLSRRETGSGVTEGSACFSSMPDAKTKSTLFQAILAKIRQVSRSHIVHKGRDVFSEGVTSVEASQVPGLSGSTLISYFYFYQCLILIAEDVGWNPSLDELSVSSQPWRL